MDNVAFWTAIVGCVTNLILLITQLVQVVKLKKEIEFNTRDINDI